MRQTSDLVSRRFSSAVKVENWLIRLEFRNEKFLSIWGVSSVGRASDLHSEGQEFESPILQNAVIAQLVRARH